MKLQIKSKISLTPIGWVTLLERAPRMVDSKYLDVWQGLRKRVMKQLTPEKQLSDLIVVKIENAERELIQAHSIGLFTMLGVSNFESPPKESKLAEKPMVDAVCDEDL